MPLISSLEINMDSQINHGETVIATIEGNFLDAISSDNVEFYRSYVRVPFDFDVANINSKYYIYFQTESKDPNNYSVKIKNVRYYVGSSVSTEEISKNFTITSEQADFNIDRGFVVTDGNFSIKVQNLNSNSITINVQTGFVSGSSGGFFDCFFKNNEVDINSGEDSITLYSGEIEDIDISLGTICETTIRTISLSSGNTSYEIPVYIIAEDINCPVNDNNTYYNNSDDEVDYKNETEGKPSFWDLFKKPNQTANDSEENNNDNEDDENPDYDIVTDENGSEYAVDNNGNVIDVPASSKKCSELNGTICSSNQICQDDAFEYAKDAKCCLSLCVKKPASKTGKIVGWTIIGLIVILLILFKIKFSKTKRKSPDFLPKK